MTDRTVLDALLGAADLLDLPLTTRAVRALADETERLLARPAGPGRQPSGLPTADQLDNLIAKARSRALSAAEADRLAVDPVRGAELAEEAGRIAGEITGRVERVRKAVRD